MSSELRYLPLWEGRGDARGDLGAWLYAHILKVEDKECAHRDVGSSQLAHREDRTASTTVNIVQLVANPTNTRVCYLQRQKTLACEWPLDSIQSGAHITNRAVQSVIDAGRG